MDKVDIYISIYLYKIGRTFVCRPHEQPGAAPEGHGSQVGATQIPVHKQRRLWHHGPYDTPAHDMIAAKPETDDGSLAFKWAKG
jgi:hypothetical protein